MSCWFKTAVRLWRTGSASADPCQTLEAIIFPIFHIGPVAFYTFGLVFGISVCLGWLAFDRYFKLHDLPVNVPVLGFFVVSAGFAGAKLDDATVSAFLMQHSNGTFAAQLQNLTAGYTYLGCALAGSLAGLIYAKVNHIPFLRGFDSLFCMGLGYGVGRIGCFLAGDGDYGNPSSLPWAMSFPHGVVPTLARVHPTMLYSSAWELAVFAVLWRLSNSRRQPALRPGTLLGLYLIATGSGRFLVEFLSLNPVLAFGLKEAQLVSAVMMISGALVLGYVFLAVRTEAPSLCGGTT